MRSRIYILLGLMGVVFLFWSVYLFVVMVLDPHDLEEARLTRYKPSKEILIPLRGSILDANGNLLVSSISYYQIDVDFDPIVKWIKEQKKKNKIISMNNLCEGYAILISKLTSLDREHVKSKLLGRKGRFVQLGNKIKESEKERLLNHFRDKGYPGLVATLYTQKRIYSKGISLARVLGSVREITKEKNPEDPMENMTRLIGTCGIEATYDKELSGKYGWREKFLNAKKKPVPYPNLHEKKPIAGLNIKLTIDGAVQDIVEDALAEGLRQYGAKNAAAIVMEVETGRILAMAGVSADDYSEDPSYVRVKSNIPVSFMFEPGSTMKPITASIAMEYNLVKPNETFLSGTLVINGRKIEDQHKYGQLTIRDVIARSSNTGISLIGQRIGQKRFFDKLIAFGYGQKSALNLFGESRGIFRKPEFWSGASLYSISFGQEISVTPIQLVTAYATIANGGMMMKPYIVDSFTDESGNIVKQFQPQKVRQVISKAVTDTIKSYLQSVVDYGTAKHIKLDYLTIAGKTGTAQKKIEGSSGYAPGKYTANFVGFFPVEKPKLACLVLYDEPTGNFYYGAQSAAPTFQKIVEKIVFLPSCNIIPQNKKMLQTTTLTPNMIGLTKTYAEMVLKKHGLSYKVIGPDSSHLVIDQFPKANVALDKSHLITIVVGNDMVGEEHLIVKTGTMPNLINLTLRRALQLASLNKIKLKIIGIGIVRHQSILAGSQVLPGTSCIVKAEL